MRRFFLATVFSHGDFRFRLRQAGYSLYDLMVTSAVASVLGVGAVGMTGLVQDARMTAEVNQMMGHLYLGRSEAIKRGTTITLCPSRNGTICSGDLEWNTGWIIFVDPNKNYKVDSGEVVIRVQQSLEGRLALRYGGDKESYAHTTYHPAGHTTPFATFTFCDGRGSTKAKGVIINRLGRPYVSSKTWDMKPLTCA
ncbi:MAG: GspH/FimT family pseudopilin [Sulfuricaulis sp.]|nr:GspH/FimT family pseudopilin [Sulfuricaulis sp.]